MTKKVINKVGASKNGFDRTPHYTDFLNPRKLTKDQKELVEATKEAMKALKEEEAKYGKKDYSDL